MAGATSGSLKFGLPLRRHNLAASGYGQIILAGVAFTTGWVKPRQMMRLPLLPTAAQFILLAGSPDILAMREGAIGAFQRE